MKYHDYGKKPRHDKLVVVEIWLMKLFSSRVKKGDTEQKDAKNTVKSQGYCLNL